MHLNPFRSRQFIRPEGVRLKLIITVLLTSIVTALVAAKRDSMVDGLKLAIGIMTLGQIWIAISHREFRTGFLGIRQAVVIAVAGLFTVAGFTTGQWSSRLSTAAAFLMLAYPASLYLLSFLYWLTERQKRRQGQPPKA
jgi:hypothetical protein